MTDTKIVEANVESRTQLIDLINSARTDALRETTVPDAVNIALTGAAIAVETAVLTGGVGSVVDLHKELTQSWAETVNS